MFWTWHSVPLIQSTRTHTRENSSTKTSTIFYRYEPISCYAMAPFVRMLLSFLVLRPCYVAAAAVRGSVIAGWWAGVACVQCMCGV